MQIEPSKFDWNLFQTSNFTFIQLSPLNSKFIQFKSFVQFRYNSEEKTVLAIYFSSHRDFCFLQNSSLTFIKKKLE